MFSSEAEALTYIQTNENAILADMGEREIKTIYTNEDTRINVMRDGKRLLRVINRYEGSKTLHEVFKGVADLL